MSASATPATSFGAIRCGRFCLPYAVEGIGHPTIVIGSVRYYQRVFSRNLRDHLRFVFMDHRGFVPCPDDVDTSEFALDKMVDDVETLRHHLALGRVAVVGHSGHAYMALEYAKKYPDSTSHVVMIGAAPDMSPASAALADANYRSLADSDRVAAERENMLAFPDERLAALPANEALVRATVRNAARAWFNPRFDCSPLWEGVTLNPRMYQHVWGNIFANIDVTQGLEHFEVPVFIALGRYDFMVAPPSSWEPIRPKLKNLTIRVFERSGHTPQFEESESFDTQVIEWLAANREVANSTRS